MPAASFNDLPSGGVGRQGPFFGVFAGRPRFPPIRWTIAGLPPRVCIWSRVCNWCGTSTRSLYRLVEFALLGRLLPALDLKMTPPYQISASPFFH